MILEELILTAAATNPYSIFLDQVFIQSEFRLTLITSNNHVLPLGTTVVIL